MAACTHMPATISPLRPQRSLSSPVAICSRPPRDGIDCLEDALPKLPAPAFAPLSRRFVFKDSDRTVILAIDSDRN